MQSLLGRGFQSLEHALIISPNFLADGLLVQHVEDSPRHPAAPIELQDGVSKARHFLLDAVEVRARGAPEHYVQEAQEGRADRDLSDQGEEDLAGLLGDLWGLGPDVVQLVGRLVNAGEGLEAQRGQRGLLGQ